MAVINTDAEIVAYGSGSGVALTDSSKVTSANRVATEKIRQAALNDYTALSFEDLTSGTAPHDLKQLHCWIALAMYTDGDAARPTAVDDRWIDAQRELGFLAGGTTHYDELLPLVLIKRSHGSGSSVRHLRRNPVIFEDSNDAWLNRNEKL